MPNRIPVLIAMAYGAVVVLIVLLWSDAIVPVAVVGGIIVGMAFVAVRPKPGEGRARDRNRG